MYPNDVQKPKPFYQMKRSGGWACSGVPFSPFLLSCLIKAQHGFH